jgi:S1-C subfamily serine protease
MKNRLHGRLMVRMLSILLLLLAITACNSSLLSNSSPAATSTAPAVAAVAPTTAPSGATTNATTAATASRPDTALTSATVVPVANSGATTANTPGTSAGGTNATTSNAAGNATTAQESAGDFRTAIRRVTQQVKPAVAQITNLQQVQSGQFNAPYTAPAGVGSGVIYDDQGHILTNNHVVEGATQLQVSLPNGQSYPAKLIGADPQTDLAVVQIKASNLPVAKLGNSSKLQVGDWLVAIGNALGLTGGPTVSEGVVSALGRTVQEPGEQSPTGQSSAAGPYLFDVIQTDTPINPGNSGGPLINLDGEVIGINTLVAGQAEPGVQAQGIGFAIAIDTVKPIADQLVKNGRVVHPFLGVSYVPLNPAISAQLNVNTTDGVVVETVVAGGPSAQAGIQQGDLITAADGEALKGESALAYALNKHKPGDKITLTLLRQGQKKDVTVTLAERPQD